MVDPNPLTQSVFEKDSTSSSDEEKDSQYVFEKDSTGSSDEEKDSVLDKDPTGSFDEEKDSVLDKDSTGLSDEEKDSCDDTLWMDYLEPTKVSSDRETVVTDYGFEGLLNENEVVYDPTLGLFSNETINNVSDSDSCLSVGDVVQNMINGIGEDVYKFEIREIREFEHILGDLSVDLSVFYNRENRGRLFRLLDHSFFIDSEMLCYMFCKTILS